MPKAAVSKLQSCKPIKNLMLVIDAGVTYVESYQPHVHNPNFTVKTASGKTFPSVSKGTLIHCLKGKQFQEGNKHFNLRRISKIVRTNSANFRRKAKERANKAEAFCGKSGKMS